MSSARTIFDICKQMEDEGFQYGSLAGSQPFKKMTLGPYDMRKPTLKPYGLYFSKIVPFYLDIEDDTDVLSLGWHEWIVDEKLHIPEYSMRSLMFAKFDDSRLVSEADPRFKNGGEYYMSCEYYQYPNWHKVANQFAGIHIDGRNPANYHVFPDWFVNTICIWDPSVLTEFRWFPNAGKPWEYDSV